MSNFHKEAEHMGFALLFDSFKIEDKFKSVMKGKIYLILLLKTEKKNKYQQCFDSAEELTMEFYNVITSAISCVAIAKDSVEAAMIHTGFIKPIAQGLNICTACLAKSILACEEQLEVLKDIQEMTKVYAAKL